MPVFNKTIEKGIDTVNDITKGVIKNSKTGDTQDARRSNEAAANSGGFLDRNIHEIVILILLIGFMFSSQLGLPENVVKILGDFIPLIFGYLFGRQRR